MFDAGAQHEPIPVKPLIAEFARRVDQKLGMPGHIIRAYNARHKVVLSARDPRSTTSACAWWARHHWGGSKRSDRVAYDGSTVHVLSYPKIRGGDEYTPELAARLRVEASESHRRQSALFALDRAFTGRTLEEMTALIFLIVTRLERGTLDQSGPLSKSAIQHLRMAPDTRPFIEAFTSRGVTSLDFELLRLAIDRWEKQSLEEE